MLINTEEFLKSLTEDPSLAEPGRELDALALLETKLNEINKSHEEAIEELKELFYQVDVDKVPTIQDEAWANQFDSKAEAFWYGQKQYREDILQKLEPREESNQGT